jgi:hypothetical protein
MVMTYIPSDVPWHEKQKYVWFRGEDLNNFWDIRALPVLGGCTIPPHMVMTNKLSNVPRHKKQEYLWLRGRDLNCFWDIRALSV